MHARVESPEVVDTATLPGYAGTSLSIGRGIVPGAVTAGGQVQLLLRIDRALSFRSPLVILTQPREAQRSFRHQVAWRIAACSNSLLLEGVDFSADERVNREIASAANFPVLLYPSADALNLSYRTAAERLMYAPAGRKLLVFVIDGTWKSARKMIRLSCDLAKLPRICFEPPSPSDYRIRRQPKPHCYSTIEAIHHVLQLLTPCSGGGHRPQDNLLTVFRSVIEQQLTYTA